MPSFPDPISASEREFAHSTRLFAGSAAQQCKLATIFPSPAVRLVAKPLYAGQSFSSQDRARSSVRRIDASATILPSSLPIARPAPCAALTISLWPTLGAVAASLCAAGPDRPRRALERVGDDCRPAVHQRDAAGRERELPRSHRPARRSDFGAPGGRRSARRARRGRSQREPRDGQAAGDREVARDGRRPLAGSALGSAGAQRRPGSPDTALGVLSDLLGVIGSRLDSVRDSVERRHALAAATPSIWPVAGWLTSSYGTRKDPFTDDQRLPSRSRHLRRLRAAGARHRRRDRQRPPAPNGAYGNMVDARPRLRHRHEVRPPLAHRGRRRASTSSAATSSATSARPAARPAPHLHYEIWMNGRLTNPMTLLAR